MLPLLPACPTVQRSSQQQPPGFGTRHAASTSPLDTKCRLLLGTHDAGWPNRYRVTYYHTERGWRCTDVYRRTTNRQLLPTLNNYALSELSVVDDQVTASHTTAGVNGV